jgi:hypothetical protein
MYVSQNMQVELCTPDPSVAVQIAAGLDGIATEALGEHSTAHFLAPNRL